ncbi:MAG: bifunctional UDP-N-acetylglucosamine diphosphorylase/glucosamine-1-phosphate N-acetyltransferase GlmU [Steroidobacteraceae bacterium]|jgi:bifunctional UDP-N-acetylglucosamine pyrophosphorylase/glucosamine-1-phosphate N-acetyltransferase|nr:bifunctional UDP-N-acetylglucosamine diphosphorylase/glucosamine-1-phosphate N-acetyltransferase GlmU [Steroidobacteraceae bacterium]MBP9129220.1 bifunctional UDP-N-acetylglucosamine diphosphorylase/glucosamine-1-phosphate N-acetyltransferase GlmU [Steroidobacteraceae bacterium]
MPISVVILAAGQGKRMKSDLPKVLQPVAGRPLLQHVIDSARELSASDIHVVYGHGGERVRETLAAENVTWALQAEQLGTGHAVQQAMPAVPDDHLVLILFGDVPLVQAATMQRLVDAATNGEALGVLSVRMKDPTGYGRIVRDRAGTVARIVEHKDANQKERAIDEVNTGLMAASAKRMREWLAQLRNDNAQGEYYLTDVVVLAAKAGLKVNVIPADSEDEVLGVNDKVQLAEVESIYRKRRATELMLQGVTLVDPARFDARGSVTAGRDVHIDVNVVLEGTVILGNRVRIGPNVVIRDSEIGDDTVVFPNCVIDRASIGPNCNIGPFARFRPSSSLAQGVHVGNFVEVKNSILGAGAKANHLTYLGDATVGEKVNVGAGTITCNYDGANKWRTEIGAGAFIGSGAMLVAPVKIGAGATIGAGSTITKNAPDDKLTLERSKQLTLDGWKRPVKQPKG